jgi:hypothetical protein
VEHGNSKKKRRRTIIITFFQSWVLHTFCSVATYNSGKPPKPPQTDLNLGPVYARSQGLKKLEANFEHFWLVVRPPTY